MGSSFSTQRVVSVARKECLHILRDPGLLFFAFFIPIMELFMLGFAIDTNVRNVRTVVLDQARTQESRTLIKRFENSRDLKIVDEVFSNEALSDALVSGRARVGIQVPEHYSRRLQAGETAQVLVLVDGSESSVAAAAVNIANAIALRESLALALGGRPLQVDSRPRVLYNPTTRSANFFIPGLMVVMTQMMAVMLSANAIVREKENGTLEQLFMTPVRAGELILGKLTPYLGIATIEFCTIAAFMRTVFQVPIHGHFLTLLALSIPFILAMLGMGLFISTKAGTREAASQMAMGTVLPSIFLSGYVFPVDSMPWGFQYVAQVIPTTWLIDAARGVILRGAGWSELLLHALVLSLMAVGIFTASVLRFKKQL